MFHGRSSFWSSKVFRQYDPSLEWRMTWQGPSHAGPGFPWDESFVACETFLRTISPTLNLLTFTFLMQYLAIAALYFSTYFEALSLTSLIRSKLLFSSWGFLCTSYVFTQMFVNPISINMMASVPNVSLNGVFLVGTFVVVLYAHRTLGSSSGHAPFAP